MVYLTYKHNTSCVLNVQENLINRYLLAVDLKYLESFLVIVKILMVFLMYGFQVIFPIQILSRYVLKLT